MTPVKFSKDSAPFDNCYSAARELIDISKWTGMSRLIGTDSGFAEPAASMFYEMFESTYSTLTLNESRSNLEVISALFSSVIVYMASSNVYLSNYK